MLPAPFSCPAWWRRTRISPGTTSPASTRSSACRRRRTSCVGAATAKPRLDVVIRNAINDGTIVGPRYLAASQEITVPGGLGDTTQPHLPQAEFAFGAVVSGVEEMRRCVRMFCKYGVDS